MPLYPAVFLDRDGVIIANRADYVKSLAEVQFLPGALAALARLAASPARIVIVTNQSAIGRGLVSAAIADTISHHVVQQVAAAGGRIDGVYVCPHTPDAGCACRKPRPGLLLRAAAELGLDLPASTLIGDAVSDLRAAHAAGAGAILVRTGLGQARDLAAAGLSGVPVVDDLAAAVEHLLAQRLWPVTRDQE
jgi:D-glycero-D-manno-heptose 1,7-bisphosphate phosphatase